MKICESGNCTGCGACLNICPTSAIEMIEDEEGFIEPVINEEKCIKCNRCSKICPSLNSIKTRQIKKAYAATSNNKEVVIKSSSGGSFSEIANYVLEHGGYVCGAAFDDNLKVKHIIINNKKELYKLRGSKYIQSNTDKTFQITKKILENNKLVLYSGTPCQIAGLRAFLGKEYENLITIDLICHGVPPQELFDEYIVSRSKNKPIKDFCFRYKDENDTNCMILKYRCNNKIIKIKNPFIDSYYYAFLQGYIYRKSCYNCKYANCNRVGDITLGDFWGVNDFYDIFKTSKGVSAILVNTEKGEEILNRIENNITKVETDIEKIKRKNHNLTAPTNYPEIRNIIFKDLNQYNYQYIEKKYLTVNRIWLLKLKSLIPLKYKEDIKCTIMKLMRKSKNGH